MCRFHHLGDIAVVGLQVWELDKKLLQGHALKPVSAFTGATWVEACSPASDACRPRLEAGHRRLRTASKLAAGVTPLWACR